VWVQIEVDLFSTTTAEPRDGGEGFPLSYSRAEPQASKRFDIGFYSLYHDFSSLGFVERQASTVRGQRSIIRNKFKS